MDQYLKIKPIVATIVLIIVIFTIIVTLGKVLTPFIIALILSYIVNPLIAYLHYKLHIKRTILSFIIAIIVFLVFVSIPIFLLPNILLQINTILKAIPNLITIFNHNILIGFNQRYQTNFILDYEMVKTLLINNIGSIYDHVNIFSPITHNSMILIELLVYIILIPFIMFYTTNNWQKVVHFFEEFIPKRYSKLVHDVIKDIDKLLAAYLRGQISVMLIMSIYYMVALNITDLKSATIIGLFTGLVVFIPYLGILSGLIIALTITFADFHNINLIIQIFTVFIIGHLLEGGLVTPFLVGGKIGLNPIMIIFALMVFGKLFGFVGILLALPLATIAVVLLHYIKLYYLKSDYYNENY